MAIPVSVEALYDKYDRMIDQTISAVSRGRCPRDEQRDIKQEVYERAIGKNFLGRTEALFAKRGGGSFEKSLYTLVHNVAVNHFERNACRPHHHSAVASLPEETDAALDDLLADAEVMVQADFARQFIVRDSLDRFCTFLQSRQGQYTRHLVHTIGGDRLAPTELVEVYRLWKLYGESRQVTHEIAKTLQLTENYVRLLKKRVRDLYAIFVAL